MKTQAQARLAVALLAAGALAGCRGHPTAGAARGGDARVLALAERYVAARFEREPLEATEASWPAAAHGRLPDHSLHALANWHDREDAWLAELRSTSSLALPAVRDPAPAFRARLLAALERDALPAVRRFRDFLAVEYR